MAANVSVVSCQRNEERGRGDQEGTAVSKSMIEEGRKGDYQIGESRSIEGSDHAQKLF
jgi:hypothetical protein